MSIAAPRLWLHLHTCAHPVPISLSSRVHALLCALTRSLARLLTHSLTHSSYTHLSTKPPSHSSHCLEPKKSFVTCLITLYSFIFFPSQLQCHSSLYQTVAHALAAAAHIVENATVGLCCTDCGLGASAQSGCLCCSVLQPLQAAARGFTALEDYSKAAEAQHLVAVFCHAVKMTAVRNYAAGEFHKLMWQARQAQAC